MKIFVILSVITILFCSCNNSAASNSSEDASKTEVSVAVSAVDSDNLQNAEEEDKEYSTVKTERYCYLTLAYLDGEDNATIIYVDSKEKQENYDSKYEATRKNIERGYSSSLDSRFKYNAIIYKADGDIFQYVYVDSPEKADKMIEDAKKEREEALKALEEANQAQQEQQTVKENVESGKTMGTWSADPDDPVTGGGLTAKDFGADKVDPNKKTDYSGGTQIVGFH